LKRIVTVIFLCLILSLNVCAFRSKEANFSCDTPSGFIELNTDNIDDEENEMFLNLLSHSEESFKKYFKDNNIQYFAMKADNSAQIMVRTARTDFTEVLEDMSTVKDEELKMIASSLLPKNAHSAKVQTNGTTYLQTISSGKDSGGEFSAVTYITVKNGLLYTVVFNYPKSAITQEILDESFNHMINFKITDNTPNLYWSFEDILITVLIILAVIAILIFVVLIIISFVKDIIKKRKIDRSGEFKIKRRKF